MLDFPSLCGAFWMPRIFARLPVWLVQTSVFMLQQVASQDFDRVISFHSIGQNAMRIVIFFFLRVRSKLGSITDTRNSWILSSVPGVDDEICKEACGTSACQFMPCCVSMPPVRDRSSGVSRISTSYLYGNPKLTNN